MKLKKVIASTLAAAMVLSLIGCGSSGSEAPSTEQSNHTTEEAPEPAGEDTANETNETEEAPEETEAASEAPDTITVMVPPVTGTYVDDMNEWIKEYQKDHPNITVNVIATSWDEHTSKLTTMALANEAPDITEVSYGAVGTFVEMGVAVNIKDYLSEERLADYDQNALDYMTLEDTLYGLPLYITIQALGGNKEMLENAGADVEKIQTQGWTYDEFLKVIEAGTTEDCYGFVFANSGATAADFVRIFGVSAGITADFTPDLEYIYTSDNMLTLLETVEDMVSSGYMPNYAVEAGQRLVMLETGETLITGKAMQLFENNVKTNIAGLEDGSAAEGTIEMEYVFLPVPTMENVSESTYGVVDGLIALKNANSTEEHLKNVCEFMDFISSGERAAMVDNAVYLSAVCESGRKAQEAFELDQSELNAAATERAIGKVVAPPSGITPEMSANAKLIMDETIVPKFQALLAGEATAQAVYDEICKAAHDLFGEENCASGWVQ